jgi:ABC-2 type transport system permease protein
MADLGVSAGPVSSSALGSLARRQYSAITWMRFRMLTNSVRSVQGAFEFSAKGVAFIIYSMMGVGLGIGLGAGAYALVKNDHFQFLPALFWTVFLVWQVLPIALASFQEQFDVSSLLRFPVSFGSFYLLSIAFGLVDVPAILGGICCIGIWTGVTLARPALWAWMAVILVAYAVFNILLGRAVLAWVDRWLAKRRTREIVSALFLLLMLSLQLLNPALHEQRHSRREHRGTQPNGQDVMDELPRWTKSAVAVEPWLPPGLAADGVLRAAEGERALVLLSLGGLGVYMVLTAVVLAVRLRAEYAGERLSEAPAARRRTEEDSKWLLDGSGPIAAVIEKELRIVPRSMPLLFAMGAPLLTVLVISSVLKNTNDTGHPFSWAFPLCVCYALLGFTQMIFNNLGSEGAGIQMLFLSPTPMRTVLLAKNLLHGTLFAIVAFLAAVFATLRLGWPDVILAATTAAWVLFAVPTNLAVGNLLSMTMPYRVNLGRLSRQRGSQASALVSMLVQLLVIGCGFVVMELCALFAQRWMAVPCLLALAGISGLVWFRVLAHADSLANRNREHLIATLAKTE